MIVVDIWSGPSSMDHVARFIEHLDEALNIARHEIENGNLVNLRHDADFGLNQAFDSRIGSTA